jgi:alkylated DNA repair dioxygenase AlkB
MQIELFAHKPDLPKGFVYHAEFISREEEEALVREIQQLEFAQVKMHGVVAKRRVVHFGRGYEYEKGVLGAAPPIPEFLLPLRQRVGEFAARNEEAFVEVLVTKYPPGAGIGWHRDALAFDIIVGVSLLSECTMQFRPWPATRNAPKRTRSLAHVLEPRSAYILRGSSRARWQHHVPPAKMGRLSITFRTLRNLKNR